jgi:glycosyltransferase involved in cell wall biosynthesis
MARGTAVIAAATSSLPEICGDAAVLVPPTPDALAEGLNRLLEDPAERGRLEAAGRHRSREFIWERSAAEHVAVYRAV